VAGWGCAGEKFRQTALVGDEILVMNQRGPLNGLGVVFLRLVVVFGEDTFLAPIKLPMIDHPPVYSLSFTAASLRPELARIIAEHYLATGDWDQVKRQILSTNALQCRTLTTAIRLECELRRRLTTLTRDQVALLARATAEDRAAMAWLGVCKRHRFAFEIAAEVLREKLEARDPVLRLSDYEGYIESQAVLQSRIAQLTSQSKVKVRQVLLRMLGEAGLMIGGTALGAIQRPALSSAVSRVIIEDNPRWLAGFLVTDAEITSH
jgi:hypothetical protein